MALSKEQRDTLDLGRKIYDQRRDYPLGSSEREKYDKRLNDLEDRIAAEYGTDSEFRKDFSHAIYSNRYN